MTQIWWEERIRLEALSPKGKQVVIEGSGHFIQRDRPDVVIDSICEVAEAVRQKHMGFLDTALSLKLEGLPPDFSMNVDRYLHDPNS